MNQMTKLILRLSTIGSCSENLRRPSIFEFNILSEYNDNNIEHPFFNNNDRTKFNKLLNLHTWNPLSTVTVSSPIWSSLI